MSTLRQKRLAKAIVQNAKSPTPLNKKELVVSSGYSEISAESSAHIILEQKGTLEALEELGFDEESAKKVVKNILTKGKEENRLKAADMVFKVQGTYAPEKSIVAHMKVEPNERVKALAEKINGNSN